MKLRIFSIVLLVTLALCGCNPATPSDQFTTPSDRTTYHIESYEELDQVFKTENSELAQKMKAEKSQYGPQYEDFINALFEAKDPKKPIMNGQNMPIRDLGEGYTKIAIMTNEAYNLPWLWFNCLHQGQYVIVKITDPTAVGITLTDEMNASEMIAQIAPSWLNLHNVTDFDDTVKAAYTEQLQLANGTASALVYAYNNENYHWVTFLYDGMLVSVRADPSCLTDTFWAGFDID